MVPNNFVVAKLVWVTCMPMVAMTGCRTSKADDPVASSPAAAYGGKVAGVQSYFLSPSELLSLENLARAGDAEAALQVSNFYGFIKLDMDSHIRWLQMAVNAGMSNERSNLRVLKGIRAKRSKEEARTPRA